MSTEYNVKFQSNTPHTKIKAKPIEFEAVVDARVIHVLEAEHRNAHFTGTFQVLDGQPELEADAEAFHAHCFWYGCKPDTTWMRIKIKKGQWIEESGFNGFVVRNIGEAKRPD